MLRVRKNDNVWLQLHDHKKSSLHISVQICDIDIIQYLLLNFPELIDQPDDLNHTPLYYSILKKQGQICQLLLIHGANPNYHTY